MSYAAGMSNFLIVYNRRSGEQSVREFAAGQEREAIRARFLVERNHRGDSDIEVVVLSADSLETLERTHGRYFKNVHQLAAG